jgi:hypothetical protein
MKINPLEYVIRLVKKQPEPVKVKTERKKKKAKDE